MEIKKITIEGVVILIKMAVFYVLNSWRYKKIEFRALIMNPLRINGRKYISLLRNAKINDYSWLVAFKIDDNDPELIFSEGCNIGDFNHIAAVRRVVIGKNVLTANRVYISDNLHAFEDITVPVMHQPIQFKAEVHIGEGSWLGENVCVIGASVGKHCVVGANSVVTKDIPDYSVATGIPAKVVKRFDQKTRAWENVD